MKKLETDFAGVKMRNPLILASATPSWDGEHCHQAWVHQAGAIVPKTFAPPDKFAQHPRCGRMKIIRLRRPHTPHLPLLIETIREMLESEVL